MIENISETVIYNMAILLQIKKITFEKSDNLVNRNLLFFLKNILFMVFLELPWRK